MITQSDIRELIPHYYRKRVIFKEVKQNTINGNPFIAGVRGLNNNSLLLFMYNLENLEHMQTLGASLELIVWHELYHYLFGHLYVDPTAYKQPRLNIAMDCEINSYLLIPEEIAPSLAVAGNYALPTHKTWQYYYEHLPEDVGQPQDMPGCSMDKGQQDAITELAGTLVGDEYSLDTTALPPTPVIAHKYPNARGLTAAIDRVLTAEAGYYSRDRSLTKPHKTKGIGYAGKKRNEQPRVLIALDSSGSITSEMHRAFCSSIRRLCTDLQPTIIEFDDCIRHVGRKLSGKYWGGGTNFETVQEYAIAHTYNTIIWFTDCEGSFQQDNILHILVQWGSCSTRPVRFKDIPYTHAEGV